MRIWLTALGEALFLVAVSQHHVARELGEHGSSFTSPLPAGACAARGVSSIPALHQDVFREGLLEYCDGRCAISGLSVPELLRASHIKPWAHCATDAGAYLVCLDVPCAKLLLRFGARLEHVRLPTPVRVDPPMRHRSRNATGLAALAMCAPCVVQGGSAPPELARDRWDAPSSVATDGHIRGHKSEKRESPLLGFLASFQLVARGRFDGWTTLISEEFVVGLTS